MEKSKTYSAIFFRQRPDAPLQVAFTAPSSEIDQWARVPTKRTGNVRNFQRAEIPKHIEEVGQFFNNTANASPTAVVIGFDPLRSQGRLSAKDSTGKPIKDSDITPNTPTTGTIQVKWTELPLSQDPTETIKTILSSVPALKNITYLELTDITKIKEDTLDELSNLFDKQIQSGKTIALDEPTEESTTHETEDSPSEAEFPQEIQEKLSGLSPGEQQIVAGRLTLLGHLKAELLQERSASFLKTIHQDIQDELKPGILIDGQHRVMGTKNLGDIPFLVTALPTANWPELAFQFIVTNRTARRVPESLLISIVGNSLSKSQRAQIEQRLRQANIRVGLIEAVMRIHEDEQSPFFGLLAFGLKKEDGFLDAAAMRGKVVQIWYERQSPILELFDHLNQGKRRTDRTEYWKSEELWFEMFIAFWSATRERYKGSGVFSSELKDKNKKLPASKLMTATVLKIFQETVLGYLNKFLQTKSTTEGTPLNQSLPNADKFSELVKNTLTPLSPEFFTEWGLSGFDGSKGARDDLSDAIRKVLSHEKTIAQLKNKKNPHRLFKQQD
ncbi:hypothetical protein [Corallococcus sp. AB011P]|uniref:hypothetical protein n=1 Tax=Corallococcus sp. AB011P TaxID=2316735 RepID=UPI0011C3FED5|nr:hypothetical protein [Corallococcus sp. AB011P]